MSRDTLEKQQLTRRVHISYLMNLGDELKVSEETGAPLDVVNKLCKKYRGRIRSDVDRMIAENIMSCVMLGVRARQQMILEMLQKLRDKESIEVSICHKAFVTNEDHEVPSGETVRVKVCSVCHMICKTIMLDQMKIYQRRESLIALLIENDSKFVEFASKLGFVKDETISKPGPSYHLHVEQSEKDLDDKDRELLQKVKGMPAVDREQLIKSVEKELKTLASGSDGKL